MPVIAMVKVWAGMLLEDELRLVKVIELSIELQLQAGTELIDVPVTTAHVLELAMLRMEGKTIFIWPDEVIESLVFIEKV